jgi:hypothetical protein
MAEMRSRDNISKKKPRHAAGAKVTFARPNLTGHGDEVASGGHLDLEKATHGLGTIIVEALAKQLGARVEIVRNPHGTTVSITHGTSDCVWQPLTGVGKHSPPKSNGGSFAAV